MSASFYSCWLPSLSYGTINGDLTINGNLTVEGAATTISTTNLIVEDKLITLNDGGAADSAYGCGFEIEEAGAATAYFKTCAATGVDTATSFELKVPDAAFVMSIKPMATAVFEFAGALHVEAASHIDQDLSSDSTTAAFAAVTLGNSGLHVLDTDATHDLIIKPGSNLSADRILTLTTGDAARTLSIEADSVVNQDLSSDSATVAFSSQSLTINAIGASGQLIGDVPGLLVTNTTASVVAPGVTVQCSPDIRLVGHAWETTTNTDDLQTWAIRNVPATGAASTSSLSFQTAKEANALAEKMNISSAGNLTVTTAVLTPQVSSATINTTLVVQSRNFGAADNAVEIATGTFSGSNVAQYGLVVKPILTQTNAASMVDLLVSRTETTLGTAAQKFFSCQAGAAGATEKYYISNLGIVAYSPNDFAAVPVAPTNPVKFFAYNKSVAGAGVVTLPACTTHGYGVVTGGASIQRCQFWSAAGAPGTLTLVNANDIAEAHGSTLDMDPQNGAAGVTITNDTGGAIVVSVEYWYD